MLSGLLPVRGRSGIQLRLVLLVMLGAAPFVGLILAHDLRARNSAVDRALERNAELARLAAEQQVDLIVQARTVLDVLRTIADTELFIDSDTAGDAAARCHGLVNRIVAAWPEANAAGVVDPTGQIVCHNLFQTLQPYGDMGFFRQVVAEGAGRLQLSRFHIGRFNNAPAIIAAMPIAGRRGAGPTQGMVFVSLTLQWFARLPERLPPQSGLQLALVDGRDGMMLASNPTLPAAADPSLLPAFQASPKGGAAVWAAPGGDLLAGFAPLLDDAGDGPMVVVAMARSDVIGAADRHLREDLAILLAALLAAAAGAWAVGGLTLLRPLRRIGDVALRLGSGDLTARVAEPQRHAAELRALATTLNMTAERLQVSEFETRLSHKHLRRSEAEYRLLADSVGELILRVDENLVRQYVSPACRAMLGYEPGELIGVRAAGIVHPDDAGVAGELLRSLLEGKVRGSAKYRLCHRDGHVVWVDAHFQRVDDETTGKFVGLFGVVRDISDRHEAQVAIAASESRYQLLAHYITDLIMLTGDDQKRLYISPSVTALLGYEVDEFASLPVADVIHPDDIEQVLESKVRMLAPDNVAGVVSRFRYRHKDGRWIWVEAVGRRTSDQGGTVSTIRDLTHRMEIEERLADANRRLEVLATRDSLTGLANRRRLDELLPLEFRRAARSMMPVSLIMVDVDQFKRFNDSYGHQAGDACLRAVAEALQRSVFRPADLVARYGGEEIAVLLPDTDAAGALTVAERMRLAVRDLGIQHAASEPGIVTVSLGTATLYPAPGATLDAVLVGAADAALYRAKAEGRDRVRVAEASAVPARPVPL